IRRRAASTPLRVSPIVFGNELLFTSGLNWLRHRRGLNSEALPDLVMPPVVADANALRRADDAATCRQGRVGLFVQRVRDDRNSGSWHKLAHKNDAALLGPIGLNTLHIEPQIDLLKPRMKRNAQPLQPGVVEQESDQRNITLALIQIELNPSREPRRKRHRLDGILRHDQLAPLGSEKRRGHLALGYS